MIAVQPSGMEARKVLMRGPASPARMLRATLALLALSVSLVPAPASAEVAPPYCYNYLFVHDYQWYFVCADPRQPTCPVYFVKSNHPSYPRGEPQCVVDAPFASNVGEVRCVPTGQDMDYTHHLCVDLSRADCQVWQERRTGGHTLTRCLVSLPALAIDGQCVVEFGTTDHRTSLCYGGDVLCPVYFQGANGRTCVGIERGLA